MVIFSDLSSNNSMIIVKLKLGDDISVGLYQAEDDYPTVKLNKRTSKYLLDYPELDKIPVRNLIKLTQDEVIDKSVLDKVLEQAKTDSNSAIVVKDNIVVPAFSCIRFKQFVNRTQHAFSSISPSSTLEQAAIIPLSIIAPGHSTSPFCSKCG